jgi:hypothetical protein
MVDKGSGCPQRSGCLRAAQESGLLVPTKHVAHLGINEVRRMPPHARQSGSQPDGIVGPAGQRQDEGGGVKDVVGHRRSADKSARIDSRLAPGVSEEARIVSSSARTSSVVGRAANSTTTSRM